MSHPSGQLAKAHASRGFRPNWVQLLSPIDHSGTQLRSKGSAVPPKGGQAGPLVPPERADNCTTGTFLQTCPSPCRPLSPLALPG
jgi:hypothetical protein